MVRTVVGSGHMYEIPILPAIQGLQLYYEWRQIIGDSADRLREIAKRMAVLDPEGMDVNDLLSAVATSDEDIQIITELLTVEHLTRIRALLVDAKIDGVVHTTDLFLDDPVGLYCALFWAILANFEDYIALDGNQRYTGDPLTDRQEAPKLKYPETSCLTVVDVEIGAVARHYEQSPIDVEQWPLTRFARYQETMWLQQELERQQMPKDSQDRDTLSGPYIPEPEEYTIPQPNFIG